jgi:hypothetical protein
MGLQCKGQTNPHAGPSPVEDVPLTETGEEKGHLIKLAKQRAMAMNDHLIERGWLDQERLFVW